MKFNFKCVSVDKHLANEVNPLENEENSLSDKGKPLGNEEEPLADGDKSFLNKEQPLLDNDDLLEKQNKPIVNGEVLAINDESSNDEKPLKPKMKNKKSKKRTIFR